jgi:hypothetical protein
MRYRGCTARHAEPALCLAGGVLTATLAPATAAPAPTPPHSLTAKPAVGTAVRGGVPAGDLVHTVPAR